MCCEIKLQIFLKFCPQNRELQIMRQLDHCNIVKLEYFFHTSGEKVCVVLIEQKRLQIIIDSF